jgi:hypothetical protein
MSEILFIHTMITQKVQCVEKKNSSLNMNKILEIIWDFQRHYSSDYGNKFLQRILLRDGIV